MSVACTVEGYKKEDALFFSGAKDIMHFLGGWYIRCVPLKLVPLVLVCDPHAESVARPGDRSPSERGASERKGNFICEQFLYLREIRLLPTTSYLRMEPRLIDTASHGNAVPPRINTTISMAS